MPRRKMKRKDVEEEIDDEEQDEDQEDIEPEEPEEEQVVKQKQEPKETKISKGTFVVSEIPTQTQPMIVNRVTNEGLTIEVALAKILNELEELRGLLG